jgi:hypothetical protein
MLRTPSLIVPKDYARPIAPLDIQEAVQQWGRRCGRNAKLVWVAPTERVYSDETKQFIDIHGGLACWSVQIACRPSDPALRAWREGRSKQAAEPTESVLLIEYDAKSGGYVPMKLEEYGSAGIVSFLDAGNTWSGRGRFNSLAEAFDHARQKHRENAAKKKETQRNWARDFAKDIRRSYFKIPFLRVGVNLKGENASSTANEGARP